MRMAPAGDAAATSTGFVQGDIAPHISGSSIPTCRVNAVSRLATKRMSRKSTQKAGYAHVGNDVLIHITMYVITAIDFGGYLCITILHFGLPQDDGRRTPDAGRLRLDAGR